MGVRLLLLVGASETIERMSANKEPGHGGSQRLGPLAARPTARRTDQGGAVVAQEKVLSEIAHELGNFLHKLYYWSDYLKERPGPTSADTTAAQMLERTIKNLEDFLKVSLDYFRPTQLSFLPMAAGQLLEGLLFQVNSHLNGTPVAVTDDGGWQKAESEVLVDPGHLSHAFDIAVRHLTKQVGTGTRVHIAVGRGARGEGAGLEVTFRLQEPSEASPLFRTAEAGVEWAVAQKLVGLHGGELRECAGGRGEKVLQIFIPLRPR